MTCIPLSQGIVLRSARAQDYCFNLWATWNAVGVCAVDTTTAYGLVHSPCGGSPNLGSGRGNGQVQYILYRVPDLGTNTCEENTVPSSGAPASCYWIGLEPQGLNLGVGPNSFGPYSMAGAAMIHVYMFNPGSFGTYTIALAAPASAHMFFHGRYTGGAIQLSTDALWSIAGGGSYTGTFTGIDNALVLVDDGLVTGSATITRTP